MKFEPHSYQRDTIKKLVSNDELFLALDMGLGKTVTTLTAITQIIQSGEPLRVLIVAPLRPARLTWPAELEVWDHLRWLRYEILHGPKKGEALRRDAHLYLINYEGLPWLAQQLRGGKVALFNMVVWDESTRMKTPGSQRFKAWRNLIPKIRRRVALSATPQSERLLDLWGQIYCVDAGRRLGTSYTRWRLASHYPDFQGYTWTPRDGAEKATYRRLEGIVIRYSAAEELNMPPIHFEDVNLSLPKQLTKHYKELERKFFLELDSGENIDAPNTASMLSKCRQFAAGTVYTDEQPATVHAVKLDALRKIREREKTPLLVGYAFRTEAERILAEFPDAVHLRSGLSLKREREIQRRWDRREIPMLVCHPASAGHGLNLQRGAHVAVWVTLEWSYELYTQFIGRIYRQGQQYPVTIYRLIMQDTVDELVATKLEMKQSGQEAFFAAMRRYRTTN